MTHRDNERWQQCWRDREIGFHQQTVHPRLIRTWPRLGLASSNRIFVPLCGKSLDLLWLYRQGHGVIGVELSPLAVRAFFKESRLQAARHKRGRFTRWEHDRLTVACGDIFKLTAADLGDVKAVYERAGASSDRAVHKAYLLTPKGEETLGREQSAADRP